MLAPHNRNELRNPDADSDSVRCEFRQLDRRKYLVEYTTGRVTRREHLDRLRVTAEPLRERDQPRGAGHRQALDQPILMHCPPQLGDAPHMAIVGFVLRALEIA